LTWPDSESENGSIAPFLVEWFGELGIEVDAAVTEEGKLIEDVTGPPNGPANYDIYMWGWVGDPDPTSLLNFFRTEEIGGSSDSYYSNPEYDQMFLDQRAEPDEAARKQILDDIQQLVYNEAPYHILYYDSELHAYRTDTFANWQNQPAESGTPLFGYGPWGYTVLTAASDEPSPAPSAAVQSPGATTGAESPAPTEAPAEPASSGDNSVLLLAGIAALVAVLAVGFVAMRRRSGAQEEE
jgi:peptide/nickel transport system substrate-binding protein